MKKHSLTTALRRENDVVDSTFDNRRSNKNADGKGRERTKKTTLTVFKDIVERAAAK